MKQLVAIVFILISTGAWAEWTGASMWANYDNSGGQRVLYAGAFEAGYFNAAQSMNTMPEGALQRWGLVSIQVRADKLADATNAFYANPQNAECSMSNALKICLEDLISRTPDGKRLLNLVYANVGGWKPFTTWADYKADHGIQ